MKMAGVFSSHLKAEELGVGKMVTVTIDQIKMEKVGEDTKPVLYFEGKSKGLALNKTNTNALIDILGTDESDAWQGRKVQLYTTKVDYQGKRVLAIRIQEAPKAARVAKPAPVPVVVEREPGEDDMDGELTSDDIGF